ncbi:MAG: hypothetical protein V2A58_12005 [Planctomycetota bacterium]
MDDETGEVFERERHLAYAALKRALHRVRIVEEALAERRGAARTATRRRREGERP